VLARQLAVELAPNVVALHPPPNLAAVALRPVVNLVLRPVHQHSSRNSLFLADLAAELRFYPQGLLLQLLIHFLLHFLFQTLSELLEFQRFGERSGGEVTEDGVEINPDAVLGAVAVLDFGESSQP
jgi:hypothetical protein